MQGGGGGEGGGDGDGDGDEVASISAICQRLLQHLYCLSQS